MRPHWLSTLAQSGGGKGFVEARVSVDGEKGEKNGSFERDCGVTYFA